MKPARFEYYAPETLQEALGLLEPRGKADGANLSTVEGLASGDGLHPLQSSFQESHALQCAFCTPGFLMTSYAFLADNPEPTEAEVLETISGNICRCTGCMPIVQGILQASRE